MGTTFKQWHTEVQDLVTDTQGLTATTTNMEARPLKMPPKLQRPGPNGHEIISCLVSAPWGLKAQDIKPTPWCRLSLPKSARSRSSPMRSPLVFAVQSKLVSKACRTTWCAATVHSVGVR